VLALEEGDYGPSTRVTFCSMQRFELRIGIGLAGRDTGVKLNSTTRAGEMAEWLKAAVC